MTLENVDDVYPLSPMQEGMLFHSISQPGSGVFVEQIVTSVNGPFEPDRMKQAWDRVVEVHPVLRTAFLWDGIDEPLQVVRSSVETAWDEQDWRELDSDARDHRLSEFLTSDRRVDFDFAEAPLSRMTLIRETSDRWKWVWTGHHIQADGWSIQLLLQQCWSAYHGEELTPPELPYSEYVGWLLQHDDAQTKRYWREQLAGFCEATRLNTANVDRPAVTTELVHCQTQAPLPQSLTTRLKDFAKTQRLTLNTVIQGAWALLVSRYSGSDDVVFGVTTSGRPAELEGVENTVGLFINTLPSRVELPPNRALGGWLANLQQDQLVLRRYEHSALASIQKWSDMPAGEALFESILVFENYPAVGGPVRDSDVVIVDVSFHEQSNYPIALLVVPGEQIEFILVHKPSRLSQEAADRLLEHLNHLLSQFVDSADRPLSDFSIINQREAHKILNEWNHAVAPPSDECLHQRFEQCVRDSPESIAVVFESEQITYRELNDRADRLAHRLLHIDGFGSCRVGILANRSPEMLAAILGVLKSGACYVPLNPAWPQDHLQYVTSDSELWIAVTTSDLAGAIPESVRSLCIDETDGTVPDTNGAALPCVTAQDPAYVIYTSGSTGKPKGVEISHAGIVASTNARADFYPESPLRFLLLSSFAFDSSMVGIFWTLTTGGTVVLPEPSAEKDTHRLLQLIQNHTVTHTLCLPSLYELILTEAESDADTLGTLRCAIVAGEACSQGVVRKHFSLIPWAKLFNEYGPTEATVWCLAHEVKSTKDEAVPIGKPVACARAYVLDQHGQLASAGVVGELFIGGSAIASGYVNRPELTADRFIPDPFQPSGHMYRTGDLAYWGTDGRLFFAGRGDRQIKIRGHRVEPGEIEELLKSRPDISDAVVTATNAMSFVEPRELAAQLAGLPPDRASEMLNLVANLSEHELDQLLAGVSQ